MSTTKEYKDFILEQINLDHITCRPMMGEYLLYYNNVLFGGIYDDRMLIKISSNNNKYNLRKVIPYKGAKPMLFLENVDNKEIVKDIIIDTYNDLKNM